MDAAAAELDAKAEKGGEATARAAHKVADAIGSTASYIRNNGLKVFDLTGAGRRR